MTLTVIDTFREQDNDVILELYKKQFCQVAFVPHNLTNKFKPLDMTVNKPSKFFYFQQVQRMVLRASFEATNKKVYGMSMLRYL